MTAAPRRPVMVVLRALGIGDFVTGVPALRALRRAQPAARIALAAPGGIRVNCVAPGPVWTPGAVDVAVNLHGAGPQSHRLLQRLEFGRLLAFASADADFDGGPP